MMTKSHIILRGATLYTQQGVLTDSAIVIKDNKISAIIADSDCDQFPEAKKIDFPSNFKIVPGFIDMHIHGANGKDVMDDDERALAEISQALLAEGTTSYLATTMTAAPVEIERTLSRVSQYMKTQDTIMGAKVLGVHLEGPFLSPNKVGAQRSDLILNPDVGLFEQWQKLSDNHIKLVTLAPELQNSEEFIRYLSRKNIVASIGHTDATYAETIKAIAAGCSHATHLFNAMRGVHQREPGAVSAILLSEKINAELILDGIHLHPAIVQMALKMKGAEKLVLVTDAMRAKCLCNGVYDLGGQAVAVKEGVARLADGTLAGSTLKMSDAIKNMLAFSDCDLSDVVKMTSENPAKMLGMFDRIGGIAADKDADLVILDDQCNVVIVVSKGVSH